MGLYHPPLHGITYQVKSLFIDEPNMREGGTRKKIISVRFLTTLGFFFLKLVFFSPKLYFFLHRIFFTRFFFLFFYNCFVKCPFTPACFFHFSILKKREEKFFYEFLFGKNQKKKKKKVFRSKILKISARPKVQNSKTGRNLPVNGKRKTLFHTPKNYALPF